MEIVFPRLVEVVLVDRVVLEADVVRVTARVRPGPAGCPVCGCLSGRVHGWYWRRLQDRPVGERAVVIDLRLRRLACLNAECSRRTFREQVPDLTVRYARRTRSLTALIAGLGVKLAGRATSVALAKLAVTVSRTAVLRLLMALPTGGRPVPAVLSVDDFALRRGRTYATMIIDPVTHERIDVLADRKAETLAEWLRGHPHVTIVCREGSPAYAEAIRRANPDIVQVSDRWHLWHNLAAAVEKTVARHSGCWNTGNPRPVDGRAHQQMLERWTAVHDLLDQGVSLSECARRLGFSLNTIKRHAQIPTVEQLIRPRRFRQTLVCPTAITCGAGSRRTRTSPSPICSLRSGSSATPEVRTCWTATSARDALTPTAHLRPRDASPPGS